MIQDSPGHAQMVEHIQGMIDRGEVDDLTGEVPQLPESERPPEIIDGGMLFWLRLDDDLAGDRSENGLIPRAAINTRLDEIGIHTEENREVAHRMLRDIAIGRIQDHNDALEDMRAKREAK